MTHDYTHKGGVVYTDILLPDNAPAEYRNRSLLWNAVEKIEKAKNAQLAREIEIALPAELTREQNISLVRDYVQQCFVSAGMCADVCLHDKADGNPHAHILLTVRPLEQDGEWGTKQKKKYILDADGHKIYDPKKRQYKCQSVPTVDWNEHTKAEQWRKAWADLCNDYLAQNNHNERIDHRSYERQGIDQIPAVHLGVVASQMEKHGVRSIRGDMNRMIEVNNTELRKLKARITKLQTWLKEATLGGEPSSLADTIQDILSRKAKVGKSALSQAVYNLKDASAMLNFLTQNNVKDVAGLDAKFKAMSSEQAELRKQLTTMDQRLSALKKHLEQVDIYRKYKGKKRTESEEILFASANNYFQAVMNGKTTLPTKAWKSEYATLTSERSKLNQRYVSLKEEVREAEKIRKSIGSILRMELREKGVFRGQEER